MQTAGVSDHVNARTKPEVIGVAENDFGVELGFEGFEANAFDRAGSADRHENGRLNLPATSGQHTRPCVTGVGLNLKLDGILLSHQKDFSRGGAAAQRKEG